MVRRRKSDVEKALKASVDTCSCGNDCLRGCSKVHIITFVTHFKDILTSGLNFSSFKEFFITGIRNYQKNISPKLKTQCIFEPSCSNYAIGVIQKYGTIKGLIKTFVRLIKCSPLTKRLSFGQIKDLP
jgi:putative membrane protein insertion efficiency factor